MWSWWYKCTSKHWTLTCGSCSTTIPCTCQKVKVHVFRHQIESTKQTYLWMRNSTWKVEEYNMIHLQYMYPLHLLKSHSQVIKHDLGVRLSLLGQTIPQFCSLLCASWVHFGRGAAYTCKGVHLVICLWSIMNTYLVPQKIGFFLAYEVRNVIHSGRCLSSNSVKMKWICRAQI